MAPNSGVSEQSYRYVIRRGSGFGDCLMACLFVKNLNAQGLNAFFHNSPNTGIGPLVDVPLWLGKNDYPPDVRLWHFRYEPEQAWDGRSMMERAFAEFNGLFGFNLRLIEKTIPIRFQDDPSVPALDIVLNTRTNDWTPYKHWPYWAELKRSFSRLNLSFVDLDEHKIQGNVSLNYAAKARLYLGLDTGMSHYVSPLVQRGIIIQSGYNSFEFWHNYQFTAASVDVPCAKCFLRTGCPNDHRCMRELTAEKILDRVLAALDSPAMPSRL